LTKLIYHIKLKFLELILTTLSVFSVANPVLFAKNDVLFSSDKIIKMELRSDFTALQKDRTGNPVYHDGELTYKIRGSEAKKLSVKIMVRGNFRRNPQNCSFPPLYLNFKKNEVINSIFENQDKLKLVTPCQNEEDLFDEYMIYKMYNRVTDLSMQVRLVKILYFDTGIGKKLFEKYSFFIEEKEHVAERNNAHEIAKYVLPFDLIRENVKRVSVFQYMIGNIDWYFHTRHNILILQPNDTSLAPSAVPFDFDFSAFVNADYTKPKGVPDDLLKNRRVFKGLCFTNEEFEEIFKFFRDLRPEFESIIKNMKHISWENRKQILEFIGYFYTVTESPELIKKEFLDVCETKKTYGRPD
jgi:hypothetical protein